MDPIEERNVPRRATFRPARTGVAAPLGELEAEVMRHIWAGGESGRLASDLLVAMQPERAIALTTLLTTLDRLHDKGILRRTKEGKAYRFQAAVTEAQLNERIVAGVLDGLIARFPDAVATYFAQPERGAPIPAELAARLERLKAGQE